MTDEPRYFVAYQHLETTAELLERARAHVRRASQAGAETLYIEEAAIDKALRLVHKERKAAKIRAIEQTEREESDESESPT